MKLKKGDTVKIMVGKDKGKEGKIERVYIKAGTVLIANVNIYKRHVKKSDKVPQGGVVEVPRPLAAEKVMLVCPKCKKLTRVAYEIKNGKKMRMCRQCKNTI